MRTFFYCSVRTEHFFGAEHSVLTSDRTFGSESDVPSYPDQILSMVNIISSPHSAPTLAWIVLPP